MSAFDAGSVFGRMIFDTSDLDTGVTRAIGELGELSAAGHGSGEGVASGLMGAEAAMRLFPPLVIEFLTNPILGFVAAAKEGLSLVAETVADVAGHFEAINLGSLKSGLDPETFSTFAAAVKASGVEVQTFANGMELLQDKAANALRGDAGAAKESVQQLTDKVISEIRKGDERFAKEQHAIISGQKVKRSFGGRH